MLYCCRRQKGEQRVRTAAENRMKREWIGFLFLLLLSVRDIREKKVNIAFLLPGFVLAFYQIMSYFSTVFIRRISTSFKYLFTAC